MKPSKRQRVGAAPGGGGGRGRPPPAARDEELGGDSSDSGDDAPGVNGHDAAAAAEAEAEAAEDVASKRLRLAKALLAGLRSSAAEDRAHRRASAAALSDDDDDGDEDGDGGDGDGDGDGDGEGGGGGAVGRRLASDAAAARGDARRPLAASLRLLGPRAARAGGGAGAAAAASAPAAAPAPPAGTLWRGHSLSPTALCLSPDERTAWSASKDGAILSWDVETGARGRLPAPALPATGATGPCAPPRSGGACVLALAVSPDGRLLAAAGASKCVHVFDLRASTSTSPAAASSASHLHAFPGHRGAVTCLAFAPHSADGGLELLSGSDDRTVKRWSASAGAYVDTLCGHTAGVAAVAATGRRGGGGRGGALSVGADRSCRLWRTDDDTQLVFAAPPSAGGLESLAWLGGREWVTGGQDGSLMRWSDTKKRPAGVWALAHGTEAGGPGGEPLPPAAAAGGGGAGAPPSAAAAAAAAAAPAAIGGGAARRAGGWGAGPGGRAADGLRAARAAAAAAAPPPAAPLGDCARWVSALAAAPGTDLVASGAGDGAVRLWRADSGAFGLAPVGALPARGFVNALALPPSGRFLLAAVGQEPRGGRWARDGGARNGVLLHVLPRRGDR